MTFYEHEALGIKQDTNLFGKIIIINKSLFFNNNNNENLHGVHEHDVSCVKCKLYSGVCEQLKFLIIMLVEGMIVMLGSSDIGAAAYCCVLLLTVVYCHAAGAYNEK